MTKPILAVFGLSVEAGAKKVLSAVDLEIELGEVLVLMGANGSGKTSFAMSLMGDPRFKVDDLSRVEFGQDDLLGMSIDERARAGLYVAWQSPVGIPGVSVFNLCKAGYEARGNKIPKLTEFKKYLEDLAEQVGLSRDCVGREINIGFSGGEKKRLELLQLLLFKPKLAILDEIDSGLDIDGLKMVANIINKMKLEGTSFLIVTHYKRLIEYIAVDKICVMKKGKIVTRGGVEISEEIEEYGYGKLQTGV